MAYCTATEVKYLIHTDLDDTAVGNLITLADADLDNMLDGASLSTNLKKICSMRLTAIMIAERDPEQYTAGSTRVQYGERVKRWKRRVNQIVGRATGRWHKVDPLE